MGFMGNADEILRVHKAFARPDDVFPRDWVHVMYENPAANTSVRNPKVTAIVADDYVPANPFPLGGRVKALI